MSTDADRDDHFDPARPYELAPDVALRGEPFGALAYSYGTRRLSVVRSKLLLALLERLNRHASAAEAMEEVEVAPDARPAIISALQSLLESGVIRAR